MRIGVIRGDLPNAVLLSDLETVSQANVTQEALGQVRYINRPTTTAVGDAIESAPAAIHSTTNISFPLVIDNTNHTLLVRVASSGAYTTVTVANATYASLTTLLVALNAALVTAGLAVSASTSIGLSTTLRLILKTTTSLGVGAVLGIDSVANGSTFNTPAGLGSAARSYTVPTAAATIIALLPVGGPLDVSSATILAYVSYALTAGQVEAIAEAIAPKFIETDITRKSFQVGGLSLLLDSSFNPDPRSIPALSDGEAIEIVQDDGSTAYTAALPTISNAQIDTPNAGDITITGTDLGDSEQYKTTVKVSGDLSKILHQQLIEATNTGGTQGSVSPTSIVIPASLVPGVAATTTSVRVKFTSLQTGSFALV